MKLLALTFVFIGLTTANFNPGLGGNTGSFSPNKVGGPWIGQNCLPPEWIHIIHDPDYRCDPGLECHCKVIIDTPTYKKKKCSCQLPGSQSQLGNATTIAIRKEQGQWKLANGKKIESTVGNPTEMEGSYGTTGINPSLYENKSFYGWGLFKTILKGCVNKVTNCQRQVQVGKEQGMDYCNHHDDIIRTFFQQNCRKSCGMC